MALISLSEWIDRYGDEPDDSDAGDLPPLTFQAAAQSPVQPGAYRISALLPSGSEIADTRTRLL
jgi:hypothetical protein